MGTKLLRVTTVPESLHLLLGGQLAFMQQQGFDVLAVSSQGPLVEIIRQEGIPHQTVCLTRKITPLTDLLALWQLIRIIKAFNPVIVHSHTPKAGLLGMLAAWICRVPVRIHTVAGLPLTEASGIKKWLLYLSEKITYACAHGVYPNSLKLMSDIGRLFRPPAHKLRMIGSGSSNGIDTTFFARNETLEAEAITIREKFGIPQGKIVFSFVGRIVRDKGIHELIAAFKRVCQQLADAYLIVAGPLETDLDPLEEEDLRFLKTDPRVIMCGFQTDIRPWLLASDIFVFPSYREGFPNVVMQAVCMEIPCIVSDINGCNEIIRHEETGLVVPVKNESRLAEAMLFLSHRPDLRQQFGARARTFVASNFEQQYVWQAIASEYRRLVNGTRFASQGKVDV